MSAPALVLAATMFNLADTHLELQHVLRAVGVPNR
jgi:hypothetical protein